MKKNINLFAILCVLGFAASAWAVVPLSGQVVTDSGTPIAGATVTITAEDGSSVTTKTDQSGSWRGVEVNPGNSTITVKAEGYETVTGKAKLQKECEIKVTMIEKDTFGDSNLTCECMGVGDGVPTGGASTGKTGGKSPGGSPVDKGLEDAGRGASDAGCTNLYVLDDNGREHFIAYTLTAIGVENEKWESRAIPIPIKGDITIRLVKEMPRETTFIDQVRLRVVERNQATGGSAEYYLEGIAALKNRAKENLMTAFRKDGNHIHIYSSREPDPKSKWGVKRGDFLEITFQVPPLKPGYERTYYVLTFGYHVKKFVDLK